MKLRPWLTFGLIGWLAGGLAALIFSVAWPAVFPAVLRGDGLYGDLPSLPVMSALVVAAASPGAFVGGLIGGRVPNEGGEVEQRWVAAIGGVLLAAPFACGGLWFFTGW